MTAEKKAPGPGAFFHWLSSGSDRRGARSMPPTGAAAAEGPAACPEGTAGPAGAPAAEATAACPETAAGPGRAGTAGTRAAEAAPRRRRRPPGRAGRIGRARRARTPAAQEDKARAAIAGAPGPGEE